MPPPSLTALKPRSTPNFVICSPVKASGPENEFEPPSRISASVTPCCAHAGSRSEEHTSELQSRLHLVCRLLLEKKKKRKGRATHENGRASGSRKYPLMTADAHET